MSNNPSKHAPVSPEVHGWFVDAITAAGAQFLQGNSSGAFHVSHLGTAYTVIVTEAKGPLQDLSGKDHLHVETEQDVIE